MSKTSEMDALVNELRHCGETLTSLADALKELYSGSEAPKTEPAPAVEVPTAYTLVEVRKILTEKSREGRTAAVKELLRKHGAEKLSEVKAEEYAALVREAEGL